jgi:hypothetical protein
MFGACDPVITQHTELLGMYIANMLNKQFWRPSRDVLHIILYPIIIRHFDKSDPYKSIRPAL